MADAFSPVQIGPIGLRNRFIRSGANEMMVKASLPTRSLLELHRAIAAGGTGMTTLAYIAISRDGRTFSEQGVIDDRAVPHYRAITDAIHAEGAKASAQITHGGSFVQHKELSTRRAMSSSGGIDKMGVMMGRVFQRQMTRADMDQIVGEFVAAAERAVAAGFDAVELHMGHGYLLNQYVSPLSNKRTDEYGGTAANRIRYPAEVLAAVKRAVGDRIAVLAKINLLDGVAKGATVDDAIVTARALEAAGADMLVLSAGRNIEASWQIFGSPMPYDDLAAMQGGLLAKLQFKLLKATTPKNLAFRELYLLDAAKKVRAAVSTKLGYLGGVQSLEGAETALDAGFDAVVMARALVHDPDIVNKFRADRSHHSQCTACNRCVAVMYGPAGTYCPVVDNPIDVALNQIPAGEDIRHAA
ncbi:NADH:flavin oxidoreductase [Flavisphingomonas formosensis]|uniref:NADH:flavin oxidoreductase n=1 Tax=Flavisphingomonas formosensis TaxID=861534 RepID=UPI0012F8743C|nr:NADH:flavin oxidoreductase [Sphingomonas formosensis]